MLIRQAKINDARRISYLIRRNTEMVIENLYTSKQVEVWKSANVPKAIRENIKERTIFCAIQNNKLIVTIGLYENEVVGLYVSYSKRGKGIGQKLLNHLEAHAKNIFISELALTSTPSAISFYLKNGFVSDKYVSVYVNGVAFKELRMTKKIQ